MKAVLVIIDGFGFNPNHEGNAIIGARTPNLDSLWSTFPHTLLKAAEEEVGLSFGQIGNSEVGHMAIGTGRVTPSPLERVNEAIGDRSFFQNPAFLQAIQFVKTHRSRLHITGLTSSSGVHAELQHMVALVALAKQHQVNDIFLHLILDGRDTGPKEAPIYLAILDKELKRLGAGTIATLSGRAHAMDRNNNWGRTKSFYDALTGTSDRVWNTTAQGALEKNYQEGFDDETIPPTVINPAGTLKSGDAIIITNFREDRARQMGHALADKTFTGFTRTTYPTDLFVVTMTEYEKNLPVAVAFPPIPIPNTLSDVLEQQGLTQLHIAETEKYAHVTYFLNGGREAKLPHEDFVNIASDPPEKFLDHPQMQAEKITDAILTDIAKSGHDVIIVNFAGPDMIGHTGDYQKTIQTVETIDSCIGRLAAATLSKDASLFITADHGNAEQKIDLKTRKNSKDHTINPVPFIMVANRWKSPGPSSRVTYGSHITGILQDVAPTILSQLNLPVPEEMTGTNLFSAPQS